VVATQKSHHITPEEVAAVIAFACEHLEEGYRRLAYMIAEAGVAAVWPTTVYLILKEAGLIGRWKVPTLGAHKIGFRESAESQDRESGHSSRSPEMASS